MSYPKFICDEIFENRLKQGFEEFVLDNDISYKAGTGLLDKKGNVVKNGDVVWDFNSFDDDHKVPSRCLVFKRKNKVLGDRQWCVLNLDVTGQWYGNSCEISSGDDRFGLEVIASAKDILEKIA